MLNETRDSKEEEEEEEEEEDSSCLSVLP